MWFKVLIAVIAALVIFRLGFLMLRMAAAGQPPPPPTGELRQVRLTYRCSVCGSEVRMTAAPMEDPEPPRHCQEDMDLVAPID